MVYVGITLFLFGSFGIAERRFYPAITPPWVGFVSAVVLGVGVGVLVGIIAAPAAP